MHQEFDQAKHDRSVLLRKKLLTGIDRRLKLTGHQGGYLDAMAERPLEPFIYLYPSSAATVNGKFAEFVRHIYDGTDVKTHHVEAGFSYIGIEVDINRAVGEFLKQGSRLLIPIPDRELALSRTIYIFPNKFPITYGIQEFTLREWITSSVGLPFRYKFDEQEVDLDIVQEIVDPILSSTRSFRDIIASLRQPIQTAQPYLVPEREGLSVTSRTPFREHIHLGNDRVYPQ